MCICFASIIIFCSTPLSPPTAFTFASNAKRMCSGGHSLHLVQQHEFYSAGLDKSSTLNSTVLLSADSSLLTTFASTKFPFFGALNSVIQAL